ncbi:uncharacterized protein C1orf105 homolog isoform X3 [Zalophus californianus]|uniref:Uncharacterized protein C1orf105 homolog isoform X3 n=1 Tax=Zalophus californianus TaxID=9704 RepID=A0A6J2EQK4_ZALCA|nr:uncharacterized protein C1orf105 homolog isoform X3 [Zalophus californianus]
MNFTLASNRKPLNQKALCSTLPRQAARGVPQSPARKIQDIREMGKRELKVSVPTFGKIPWLSEASLINKPLVLSIPKRYPHASATFLISSKKDRNLPILFQVPDVLSKARRIQSNPMLIRNKQLCSICQEIKMVQPRTMIIPHNLKLSFENFMSHREYSLQTAHSGPQDSCLPRTVGRYLRNSAGHTTLFLAQKGAKGQDNEAVSGQSSLWSFTFQTHREKTS